MKKICLVIYFFINILIYGKESILIISDFYQNNISTNNILTGILENKNPDQNIYIEYINEPKKNSNQYLKNLNEIYNIKYENINFNRIIFLEGKKSKSSQIFFKKFKGLKEIIYIDKDQKGIENFIRIILKIQKDIQKIYIPDISLKELVELKKRFYPIDFESFSSKSIYLKDLFKLMGDGNCILIDNLTSQWKLKKYFNEINVPIYAYNLSKDSDFTGIYIENYYDIGKNLIENKNIKENLKNDKIYLNGEKVNEYSLKYKNIKEKITFFNMNKNYFFIDRVTVIYMIFIILFLGIVVLIGILWKWNILKREAEESSRVKSDFIASMSHDMKTPLNSIIASVELLKKEENEKGKLLKIVEKSAEYLTNVINDVLLISEYKKKKIEINIDKINLRDFLQEIYLIFIPLINKNIKFLIYLDLEIKEIYSDKIKLKQILINLINNSLKFTEKGEIRIECFCEKEKIIFNIKDTGIGIPENERENIFKEFYQVGNRKKEGSGLGLAISKKYINLLKGDIFLEDSYKNGSFFTIKIPTEIKFNRKKEIFLIEKEPADFLRVYINKYKIESYFFYDEEEKNILIDEFNLEKEIIIIDENNEKNNYFYNGYRELNKKLYKKYKKRSILLVEDNELNGQLLKENLNNLNVETIHCKNYLELEKNIDHSNIIFMDINLEEENGYELAKLIKNKYIKKIIIGLSANKSDNGLDSYLDGFLEKPIKIEKILKYIELLDYNIDFYINNLKIENKIIFFKELKEDVEKLKNLIKYKELSKISKIIHKIKGNILAIEAYDLGIFLEKVEKIDYNIDFYKVKFTLKILENILNKELKYENTNS